MRARSLLWLGTAVVGVVCAGAAYGVHAEKSRSFPATLLITAPEAPAPVTNSERAWSGTSSELSLPYVRGRTKAGAQRPTGVATSLPQVQDGYNLVVSADGTTVRLMDLDGETKHEWSSRFQDVTRWTGVSAWNPFPPPDHPGQTTFRRAYLAPDGALLAIFEDLGLVKLDAGSTLRWAYRGGSVHHALDVGPDGTIYVLSKRQFKGEIGTRTFESRGAVLTDDELVVLSPDGREKSRFSILDAMRKGGLASLYEGAKHTDLCHTNSVHYVRNGRHVGSVLVCFRHLNTIAMLDPTRGVAVWSLSGLFHAAHEPTVLANGNILLFDNCGNRGTSRVIEIEPASQTIVWRYPAIGEDTIFSRTCGTCQRLRNGNTLITESENGRALEVSAEGRVVWEWYSPYRHENLWADESRRSVASAQGWGRTS